MKKSTAFLLVWLLTQIAVGTGQAQQIAVIAHKSVPADTLSATRLLDLYTCDVQSWSDDQPVVVFDLKPRTAVKETFYRFIGKSPSRMKSVWMKKMLSGEGNPPASLKTEEELLQKVASTPGAIGYVDRTRVGDQVKVLLVIDPPKR
jgi:ABC-type phosphate transport system substrate-binding protein